MIVDRSAGNVVGPAAGDAGSTEVEPWRHDETFHAYWVEPGVILAGEYPGSLDADEAVTKISQLVGHGIRTIIDLTADADGLEDFDRHVAAATARGAELRRERWPIPDMGVVDQAGYDDIVAAIRAATTRGGVFIHCWGGLGRTGTVVGCWLVDNGVAACDALAAISRLRDGTKKAHIPSPETAEQRAIVESRTPSRPRS